MFRAQFDCLPRDLAFLLSFQWPFFLLFAEPVLSQLFTRPKALSNFDCAHLNYKLYVGSTKLSPSSTLLLSAEVLGFSWNCACFLNLLTALFLSVGGTGLWYNVRNIIFHRGLQHGMDYTLLIFIA